MSSPHTYFAIVLFLQNDIAITLTFLPKSASGDAFGQNIKNNGKVGVGASGI